jgi:6-phosphogluconolactonase
VQLKNIYDNVAGIAEHPFTGQKRISLTYDVLNNSKENLFMVTGNEKADIVYRIMSERDPKTIYPAAMIGGAGKLKWYLDEGAALKINGTEKSSSVPKSSGK